MLKDPFMMEVSFTENTELAEVVITAGNLNPGSTKESKRAKTAKRSSISLRDGLETRTPKPPRAFFEFCSVYKLELDRVKPYHFGMWLKRHTGSVATQRQHLAAVRLLFDHLLDQGVVEANPAARAKPPRLERESSHTPVFEEEEIKAFLGTIKPDSLLDIRDKALFSVLFYSWARVSALVILKVEDYYQRKRGSLVAAS